MKLIKLSILLFSLQIFSQNTEKDSIIQNKKFEVKIAPLALLSTGNIFTGFEYYKNKDFSYGIVLNLDLDRNSSGTYYNNKTIKYQISPFVRYSLSKKQNSFFYLESYLNLNNGKYSFFERLNDEFGNGYYIKNTKKYTDFAIGFGSGYKFYIKKTIGVDFNFGFAKNLFNENSINVIPKGHILLSYRFN